MIYRSPIFLPCISVYCYERFFIYRSARILSDCDPVLDDRFTSEMTAARLAQLGERRSAEREAVGSNPGRTNTQDL